MTTMDTTNPKCFWAYIEGSRAGIKHPVKNLGWLLTHAKEVESLSVTSAFCGGAHLQARLVDDGKRAMESGKRMYYAHFDSFEVARKWINRCTFAHVVNRAVTKFPTHRG